MALMSAWELMAVVLAADTFLVLAVARAMETLPVRTTMTLLEVKEGQCPPRQTGGHVDVPTYK